MTDPNHLFDKAHGAYREGRFNDSLQLLSRLTAVVGEHPEISRLTGLAAAKNGAPQAAETAFARAVALAPHRVDIYADWARIHSSIGDFGKAEHILRAGITRNPTNGELLAALGFLKREADDRDGAALVFDHILKGQPSDLQALHARALVELEKGGDAWPIFQRALHLSSDRQLLLGAATSLHRNGQTDAAIELIEKAMASGPAWLDGLQLVARLRWERGDGEGYTDGYVRAIAKSPAEVSLWAAYLGLLASSLDFERVLRDLPEARRRAGNQLLFDMMEAQALSETGQHEAAERTFLALAPLSDPTFLPVRLRSLLRTGRADEAARLGEEFTSGPAANFVWPLLALAWRVLGDARWQWLERYDETVSVIDLGLSVEELEETAEVLRRLHVASQHPYDQSVRGGTQTTGNLFERTEPAIARLRSSVVQAVASFIESLPEFDAPHPFLGRNRGRFRFAGSWSIRLQGQGHHVSHVHPAGWISSALYLRIPEAAPDAGEQAGHLALGQPPAELGLRLPPVRIIEPGPGRLVLFPSIMWHGTIPFPAGERLTAAFDVVPFRS